MDPDPDPDPSIIKQKKKEKPLFSVCDFFHAFLSLKNDVNVPYLLPCILGSGSVLKCHGSTTPLSGEDAANSSKA